MRIALMTNNYKPFIGGVGISVERLARGLESLGHKVTVFAPTYDEQIEEENCFRYSSISQKCVGGTVLPNPFDLRIEKEFKKEQFDIIHVNHPMLIGKTAVYLSKKYRIPLTFTYHTRYEQYLCYIKGIRRLEEGALRGNNKMARMEQKVLYGLKEKLIPAYLSSFLKNCHYVFVPTMGMKKYLTDSCGYKVNDIDVLPTGIEEHHFQVTEGEKLAIRKAYGAVGMPMFLSVSRMAHEKNVTFILEGIRKVKEQYGRPFKVLMVGDGPDKAAYEEKCRELGIDQEVIFTGRVNNQEIAPYFAAADAFVFASKTETQGIVILEAFAGSSPVIALDATGVSDLVVNGVNGFLCPEIKDVFAGKILDFLTNEKLAASLSKGALSSAQEYREETVAQKAVVLYNRTIARYHATVDKKSRSFHPYTNQLMGGKI